MTRWLSAVIVALPAAGASAKGQARPVPMICDIIEGLMAEPRKGKERSRSYFSALTSRGRAQTA